MKRERHRKPLVGHAAPLQFGFDCVQIRLPRSHCEMPVEIDSGHFAMCMQERFVFVERRFREDCDDAAAFAGILEGFRLFDHRRHRLFFAHAASDSCGCERAETRTEREVRFDAGIDQAQRQCVFGHEDRRMRQ